MQEDTKQSRRDIFKSKFTRTKDAPDEQKEQTAEEKLQAFRDQQSARGGDRYASELANLDEASYAKYYNEQLMAIGEGIVPSAMTLKLMFEIRPLNASQITPFGQNVIDAATNQEIKDGIINYENVLKAASDASARGIISPEVLYQFENIIGPNVEAQKSVGTVEPENPNLASVDTAQTRSRAATTFSDLEMTSYQAPDDVTFEDTKAPDVTTKTFADEIENIMRTASPSKAAEVVEPTTRPRTDTMETLNIDGATFAGMEQSRERSGSFVELDTAKPASVTQEGPVEQKEQQASSPVVAGNRGFVRESMTDAQQLLYDIASGQKKKVSKEEVKSALLDESVKNTKGMFGRSIEGHGEKGLKKIEKAIGKGAELEVAQSFASLTQSIEEGTKVGKKLLHKAEKKAIKEGKSIEPVVVAATTEHVQRAQETVEAKDPFENFTFVNEAALKADEEKSKTQPAVEAITRPRAETMQTLDAKDAGITDTALPMSDTFVERSTAQPAFSTQQAQAVAPEGDELIFDLNSIMESTVTQPTKSTEPAKISGNESLEQKVDNAVRAQLSEEQKTNLPPITTRPTFEELNALPTAQEFGSALLNIADGKGSKEDIIKVQNAFMDNSVPKIGDRRMLNNIESLGEKGLSRVKEALEPVMTPDVRENFKSFSNNVMNVGQQDIAKQEAKDQSTAVFNQVSKTDVNPVEKPGLLNRIGNALKVLFTKGEGRAAVHTPKEGKESFTKPAESQSPKGVNQTHQEIDPEKASRLKLMEEALKGRLAVGPKTTKALQDKGQIPPTQQVE